MSCDAFVAAALLVALAACDRGSARSAAAHDAPPPAPDSALVARVAALENAGIDSLPPGAGKDLVLRACTRCHAVSLLTQQRKPPAEWAKTVDKMIAWGAPVQPSEKQALVDYLAALRPTPPPASAAPRS
jgi:competence protein ComEA